MQPLSLQGVLAAGLSLVSSAGTGGVPDSCLPLEHEITWWDNVEIKWGKLRLLRWLGLRYSTERYLDISLLCRQYGGFFCPLGYFVLLQPAEFTFTASQFLLLTLHHALPSLTPWPKLWVLGPYSCSSGDKHAFLCPTRWDSIIHGGERKHSQSPFFLSLHVLSVLSTVTTASSLKCLNENSSWPPPL